MTGKPTDVGGHEAPLSFAQERLWLSHLLAPRSPAYNIPVVLRLRGELDVPALERSLVTFVARHDALRTRIDVVDGHARQRVVEEAPARLLVTDLTHEPHDMAWERAMELVSTETNRPFDLRRGPLYRASLVLLGPTDSVFAFVVHHIAFDGWSQGILLREISSLYEGFAQGATPVLPDPPTTYAKYAAWQRAAVEAPGAAGRLAFWRELLAGDPPRLELATDRPRPRTRTFAGRTHFGQVTLEVLEGLREVARRESTTLYVTVLAAYLALLHRYTGQTDVVVGTAVAGRTRAIDHDTVGFFVNTIPLRGRLTGDPTFTEVLRRLHPVVVGALDHQDVPLEKLTEELGLAHEAGETPLFSVLFSLEPLASQELALPGLEIEWLDVLGDTAILDLTLNVRETRNSLVTMWEYSTDLFDADRIERMSAHFGRLVAHVAAHPETRLSELPLLDDAERRLLLVEWNDTERDYPRESCVHELFEEQVGLCGDRIALVSADTELTYAALNARANQLAHRLQREGVHREVPVGLCLERSVNMVVGMLGILKAGGAYVPLDPDYPQERLRLLVEDSGVSLILADAVGAHSLVGVGPRVLDLDSEAEAIRTEPTTNLPVQGRADDLVYIMYTSGSTGQPKGVCVVHRGVSRLVKGVDYATLGAEETMLQMATFSFDASTFEVWASLLNGGRLVIGPPHLSSYKELGQILHDAKVSTLFLTTGLFHNVSDTALEALSGLRQLLIGGDVVRPEHAARFKARFPECRLIHCYGPTENTSFTTTYEITGDETGPLPIGRPIANTTTYILDAHLRPVPIGVIGDLWTGGDGVARGYLNDPELTAERFIPGATMGLDDAVVYRSGDLARFRADGVILFEGRQDHQVKVNGFRVETEEVEGLLLRHPDLVQVSVNSHRSSSGENQLVAHCVAREGAEVTAASLRTFLQERAPAFMVPSTFVVMSDLLPLTPAGKVDRRALPEAGPGEAPTPAARVEARDPMEATILSIWKRLFDTDSIGVQDNFFDLGGHSLLAFRFFALLEQETGILLPLATLFEAPTVSQLAELVRERGTPLRGLRIVPIKPNGSRPPLHFVHGAGGDVLGYGQLARHLDAEQPAFGVDAIGLDGRQPPATTIEEMARGNIAEIKTVQPAGPYALAGACFGGVVALEMARQLTDQGETVRLLALFDTFLVGHSAGSRLEHHARVLASASPRDKLAYLGERVVGRRTWAKRHWDGLVQKGRRASDQPPTAKSPLRISNERAARDYAASLRSKPPYPGEVSLFLATDRGGAQPPPVNSWDRYVSGELERIVVPGGHRSMLDEPNVQVLAQLLEERLRTAAGPE